jgi:hypothetical protein
MAHTIEMILNTQEREITKAQSETANPLSISMLLNPQDKDMDALHSGDSTLYDLRSDFARSHQTDMKQYYDCSYKKRPHTPEPSEHNSSPTRTESQERQYYQRLLTSPQLSHLARGPKRQKALSYMKELSGELQMPTKEFAGWYAQNMKNAYVMERGLRLMHPSIVEVEWSGVDKYSKPKIMVHPFTVRFNPKVRQDTVDNFISKGNIAIIATFRWYV